MVSATIMLFRQAGSAAMALKSNLGSIHRRQCAATDMLLPNLSPEVETAEERRSILATRGVAMVET
ncbi:hypothetical protein TM49_04490 [Martelella endophytica]|uniref:Uncharacterized protein n=1 Tax=Martelella endophytica TaxID=1486262 RepID=A0A0D5LMW8_MAREN|nr:hypothetical protein TM49_04490 [Martelella endophytica]